MLLRKKAVSAATLVAKRKTRMAVTASNRASRMLTRLTPRGTSSDAFVKSTKKLPMAPGRYESTFLHFVRICAD